MILAGDVGATKTHLALFEENETRKWVTDEKFKSHDFESLTAIIKKFLDGKNPQIKKACFGVPGVVVEGRCHTTNLPWLVDEAKMQDALRIPSVRLMNDLEANAYGIALLYPHELCSLNKGIERKGNQALISAGTGLGEAGLFWNGTTHLPFATEGGHGTFAPEDALELELYRFLKNQFPHVSFERILSGVGLYHVYCFLAASEGKTPKTWEAEIPKWITEQGLKGACKVCEKAVGMFVAIYGAEAGNLALKLSALGGVYIGGGIAPKILPALKNGEFTKRFIAKGRMGTFLSQFPIHVILNENTALLGAAKYAQK